MDDASLSDSSGDLKELNGAAFGSDHINEDFNEDRHVDR